MQVRCVSPWFHLSLSCIQSGATHNQMHSFSQPIASSLCSSSVPSLNLLKECARSVDVMGDLTPSHICIIDFALFLMHLTENGGITFPWNPYVLTMGTRLFMESHVFIKAWSITFLWLPSSLVTGTRLHMDYEDGCRVQVQDVESEVISPMHCNNVCKAFT